MKTFLIMKKISQCTFLFICILCFCVNSGCKKSELSANTDTEEIIDDSTDADIAAQEAADDAENSYNSDALFKINRIRVSIPGSTTVVQSGTCVKYAGQAALDMEQFNRFIISGVGFGETQGTTTVRCFSSVRGVVADYATVLNWQDTAISVSVPAFAHTTTSMYLKFHINKNGILKKKGIKCVGQVGTNATADLTNTNEIITFPSGLSECHLQRKKNNWGSSKWRGEITTYAATLKAGDIVTRSNFVEGSQNNVGIIMSISAEIGGFKNVDIWERNWKCTGTLKKKKYKLNMATGVFVAVSGLVNWKEVFKT